ncbi:multicopper oxidase domain-containing protein [Streptomyces sp. NBC_01356]|uniref:multicopper oxidase family protein n=1 Tax=Streptomyces sp. NBC_01356 TaxID=2903836 RepID=UPI002E3178C0|nr:multicopper oxidase domain-containing protein [Streptomyces sp. NBC_01356]
MPVRRVLIITGSAVLTLTLVVGGGIWWLYSSADVTTVGSVDFENRLKVPPLADSRIDDQGRRVFDLKMQTDSTSFTAGKQTKTWGFNDSYLGPTLRAKRGEKVVVNVDNALPEQSTVHWHGMHLPAKMDGGPHQMIAPGTMWSPEWTVDQPAASLWYHPHPHGETEKHVQRGLAGMFILDDDNSQQAALPKGYGRDDIPLIVQDAKFNDSGSFDHSKGTFAGSGFLGNQILVNGTTAPYQSVNDELVRLRLLNGSTARTLNFGFDDSRSFSLIATDGGLLNAPAPMERLQLSPGERAEVVVKMKPGERTVLRTYPLDIGLDSWTQRFNGGDDTFDVLQLRAAPKLTPSPDLPTQLARLDLPTGENPAQTRTFDLQGVQINGQSMDMNRIDATVARGTEEVWKISNTDGSPHNFHVHDVQFKVLDVDGNPPPAHLRGPKDTVFLPPQSTVRIALRFTGPTDPDHPYMFHCHLLFHEDTGMMGQFVVADPGESPRQSAGGDATSHQLSHS